MILRPCGSKKVKKRPKYIEHGHTMANPTVEEDAIGRNEDKKRERRQTMTSMA